jgi:hypothetical protein
VKTLTRACEDCGAMFVSYPAPNKGTPRVCPCGGFVTTIPQWPQFLDAKEKDDAAIAAHLAANPWWAFWR